MRRARSSRGAAAVEFALLVPFLLLLVFGVVDFGYMLNRDAVVNNATREGVRTASVGGSSAEVTATVKEFLEGWPGALTVTVSCLTPDRHAVRVVRRRRRVGRHRDRARAVRALVGDPGGPDLRRQHHHPRQDQPDEDRVSARERDESGAVAVLVALLAVVLFVSAAIAVDITQKVLTRQTLHDTLDTAAHAGAYALPGDGVGAKAAALAMAKANDPSVVPHVDLWCVVASTGAAMTVKSTQIPSTCNPGPAPYDVAHYPGLRCNTRLCSIPCVAEEGDTCNTVRAADSKVVPFDFAPVMGIDTATPARWRRWPARVPAAARRPTRWTWWWSPTARPA